MLRMDKLNFALEVTVVGFSVVLVTLFLLYVILLIFSHIFDKKDKSGIQNEISANSPSPVHKGSDDSKLTAILTAAIFSYIENYAPASRAGRIRVVAQPDGSGVSNSWQIIGRRQLMEGKAELETIRRNSKGEKI